MNSLTPRLDRIDQNYFMNSGFELNRIPEGNATTLGYTDTLVPDRWLCLLSGGWNTNPTAARNVDAPSYRTRNTLRFASCNAVDTDSGIYQRQRIESIYAGDLAGKKISLGFKYRGNGFRQASVHLRIPTIADNFGSTDNFESISLETNNDNSQYRICAFEDIQVPLTATRGLEVLFKYDNSSVIGTNFEHLVGEFKLNIGETLQDYSWAGGSAELDKLLCERYMWLRGTLSSGNWQICNAQVMSGGNWIAYVQPRVPLRNGGALILAGSTFMGNYYTASNTGGISNGYATGPRWETLEFTGTAGGSWGPAGENGMGRFWVSNGYVGVTAEL